MLNKLIPSELVVVNLGAHDGSCRGGSAVKDVINDVANCAFDLGARGVAVEGLELASTLEGRWPGVIVHAGYVSPSNVSRVVEDALFRLEAWRVDLLKIESQLHGSIWACIGLRSKKAAGPKKKFQHTMTN